MADFVEDDPQHVRVVIGSDDAPAIRIIEMNVAGEAGGSRHVGVRLDHACSIDLVMSDADLRGAGGRVVEIVDGRTKVGELDETQGSDARPKREGFFDRLP
jgi:hypothetical protein